MPEWMTQAVGAVIALGIASAAGLVISYYVLKTHVEELEIRILEDQQRLERSLEKLADKVDQTHTDTIVLKTELPRLHSDIAEIKSALNLLLRKNGIHPQPYTQP